MAHAEKAVNDSLQRVLAMMKSAGFEINAKVHVVVDPDLPFMGYTFPKGSRFTIVVSGRALESGMLEGLLVHEMSHVYRMIKSHPSHSEQVINDIVGSFVQRGFNGDYQQKTFHDAVNHLEDLYADDISFKVFDGSKIFPAELASDFFQSWITPEPANTGNQTRDRWLNAALMLRNSFALSNMARHRTPDVGGKAKSMNDKFLSQMPPNARKAFEYFYSVMTSLEEDVTEKQYRNLLNDYLEKFVELAQATPQRS